MSRTEIIPGSENNVTARLTLSPKSRSRVPEANSATYLDGRNANEMSAHLNCGTVARVVLEPPGVVMASTNPDLESLKGIFHQTWEMS